MTESRYLKLHLLKRWHKEKKMAQVECEVEFVELENSKGFPVDGVRATCGKCGHETESFGTGEKSIKRCLVLLSEECPENEKNFYVDADNV